MLVCNFCERSKSESEFHSRPDIKRQVRYTCKSCLNKYSSNRQKAARLKAIEFCGGKCFRCGYLKCISALEFHHLDRQKKSPTFSCMRGWSWKRLVKELEECILLCSNCHREEEERIREVSIEQRTLSESAETIQ